MVFIDDQGLHIVYHGTLFAITNLSSDKKGIYVSTTSVLDDSFFIRCPDGHPNPPWNLVCAVCGKNLY